MIQNKKRIISLILMLTLLVSALVVGAVTASAAGEETIKYTISSYPAGTQYKAETHQLDDYLTVITNTRCHFTSELRIYAPSGSVNGEVVLSSTRDMTTIVLNAGNKASTLTVSTSPDNSTWTQHSTLSVASSYKDLTISNLPVGTRYVKLVNGSGQVRVNYITVTYAAESGTTPDPEVPECEHSNTTAIGTARDATCTEDGITAGVKCANDDCNYIVEEQEVIPALGHDFDRTATGNGRCKNCEFVAPKATFVFAEGENNVIYATNKESHVKAPAVSALTGSYAKEYTFVGWAKMEDGIDGETTTAPTLYQPEKYITLTEDSVFFAVYTYQVVDGNASNDFVLTDIENIKEDDLVVITMTKGNTSYALPNNGGTSSPTATNILSVSNNKLSETPSDFLLWNISKVDGGYVIYVNGSTTTYLYCTNSNSGVRVGDGENNIFTISTGYLKNTGLSRYVGVYTTKPDWRCYSSTTTNIGGQTLGFYVKSNGVTTYYVTSLECNHDWTGATCTAPKTCSVCGATEGEALGHNHENCPHVAYVGDGYYTDLQDAVNAAAVAGGDVHLIKDVVLTEKQITVTSGELVIYLDGHNITAEYSGDVVEVLLVSGTGVVNIEGDGKLYSKTPADRSNCVVSAIDGGQVYIYGGKYVSSGCAVIYATRGGHIKISGGYFEAEVPYDVDGRYYVLDFNEAETNGFGTIAVTGGTFVKFNPANHSNDGKDYTNKVVEGYVVKAVGDIYTVVELDDISGEAIVGDTYYETLEQAIAGAEAGATIKLNANITVTGSVEVTNNVIIDLNGKELEVSGDFITFHSTTRIIGDGKLVIDKEGLLDMTGTTEYVPVWHTEGYYTFEQIKSQVKDGGEAGNETVIFRPAFVDGSHADIFGDVDEDYVEGESTEYNGGAANNGISFVVSITWEGLEKPKEYTLSNTLIAEIYSQKKAIQLGFENWQADVEYTVTLRIVSGGLYYETELCTMLNGDVVANTVTE